MPSSNSADLTPWALILGGSGAMGFAAIKRLAASGYHIFTLYREIAQREKLTRSKLTELSEQTGVKILAHNWNALDPEGRERFVAEFREKAANGCIALLLHAIARGNMKPLTGDEPLSPDDVSGTLYAMSSSLLDWVQTLHKEGLFAADARVIGLTSAGNQRYWPGYASVAMAKASLESLCRYLAVEMAPFGVRTNVIQAGFTRSDALMRIPKADELLSIARERNPFGRLTEPEDVANVIYLLSRPEAAWINGALITVDGGEHCL